MTTKTSELIQEKKTIEDFLRGVVSKKVNESHDNDDEYEDDDVKAIKDPHKKVLYVIKSTHEHHKKEMLNHQVHMLMARNAMTRHQNAYDAHVAAEKHFSNLIKNPPSKEEVKNDDFKSKNHKMTMGAREATWRTQK